MSIKLTIFDGAISMLDEVAKANYGQGLDALDHAGTVIRENTRNVMKAHRHHWKQYVKNGRRRIVREGMNLLGARMNRSTGSTDTTPNMSSLITSNLMASSMTMVVGGRHKRFVPKMRRDGKVVGTLAPVSAVGQGAYQILKKLDNGGKLTGEYRAAIGGSGKGLFPNVTYKRRSFFDTGRSLSMSRVRSIMTDKLESLIHKQVNRATIKVRQIS